MSEWVNNGKEREKPISTSDYPGASRTTFSLRTT